MQPGFASRIAPWIAALAIAIPSAASAYTIKTSSSGAPVHWAAMEVELVPALTPGPTTVSLVDATSVTTTSAQTWRDALTGTDVSLAMASTTATAAPHQNDGVNTVRWALGADDPDIERGVLALTFVAYRTSDGVISDADVVINAADFVWTANPTGCTTQYDLQSALTHELGHALGMAHSADHPEATMFATGAACETLKRDLAADDRAGLADLYPQSSMDPATDPGAYGCSVGGRGGSSGAGLAVLAFALVALRKRRAAGLAVVSAVALGVAGRADASQLRRLALADLGREAVMVVRGHVVAATATRDGAIETDSEITVDECLAGDCPVSANVHVVRRGGERDGVGVWVDGEAAPAPGAEVVVYLRRDARGQLRVLGGVQGLWHVVTTPSSTLAVRDLRGHHVLVETTWQAGGLEAVDLDALARSLPPLK